MRKCPFCKVEYAQVPRHVRKVHLRDPAQAKKALIRAQGGNADDYSDCPFEGCVAVVIRVDRHLKKVHNLPGLEIRRYMRAMRGADRVSCHSY